MIGDAHAAGKRHSTRAHGPEFKKKNSRGQSHKHIDHPVGDSGSDREVDGPAARATKGHKAGTATRDKQAPHKQKERIENKHVDQGNILDEWCRGKRKCYK